jgi:Uma2 family endonuclease
VYADISVVCPESHFEDDDDILANPTLMVEVLSPSTERDDRSNKFLAYQTINSFQEYLLDCPLTLASIYEKFASHNNELSQQYFLQSSTIYAG